jgi:hypothetical protein
LGTIVPLKRNPDQFLRHRYASFSPAERDPRAFSAGISKSCSNRRCSCLCENVEAIGSRRRRQEPSLFLVSMGPTSGGRAL